MSYATDGTQWYALWTRSRHEKTVAAALDRLGIQYYLPLVSEVRQWSDRKQAVTTPLFSSYLFVLLNPAKGTILQVLRTPGAISLVGNNLGPLPIPQRQIDDIRMVLATGIRCGVHPAVEEGDRVRVTRGALAGVEGTLLRAKAGSRLLVSIEMIRQSIAVDISPYDVELIGDKQASVLCSSL